MINEAKCVLLIDDDVVSNFYNKKVIKKHDFFADVIMINNGIKALDYLLKSSDNSNKKPDLIFLDLNMPAMNGWEFIEEYQKLDKNLTKNIKLIILTTSQSTDDYQRSLNNKLVNGFVNKPLSVNLLNDLTQTHFGNKTE